MQERTTIKDLAAAMHVIQPHSAVRKACISQFESFFIDTETCYTEEQKGKLRDVLIKIR
jgi:hypothetical protein